MMNPAWRASCGLGILALLIGFPPLIHAETRPSALLSTTTVEATIDALMRQQALLSAPAASAVKKDSVRNGAIIGAIVGAVAGYAGGFIVNALCEYERGACPRTIIGFTAIGVGGGAAIGAGIDGLRHSTARVAIRW